MGAHMCTPGPGADMGAHMCTPGPAADMGAHMCTPGPEAHMGAHMCTPGAPSISTDLHALQGTEVLVMHLVHGTPRVKAAAAHVLGTAGSNNPTFQEALLGVYPDTVDNLLQVGSLSRGWDLGYSVTWRTCCDRRGCAALPAPLPPAPPQGPLASCSPGGRSPRAPAEWRCWALPGPPAPQGHWLHATPCRWPARPHANRPEFAVQMTAHPHQLADHAQACRLHRVCKRMPGWGAASGQACSSCSS
jgi:hypothetical protein